MSSHPRPWMAGHEPDNIPIDKVVFWSLLTILLGIFSGVFVWGFIFVLGKFGGNTQPAHAHDPHQIPYKVKQWAHPMELGHEARAQQAKNIEGYAWVDQSKGTVRLPIDRAMSILTGEGATTQPAEGAK